MVRRLLLGMLVLLLAGCAAEQAGAPAPSPTAAPATAAPVVGNPVELVRLWTVREAAGEEPGAILRIGDDLSLWRRCGIMDGGWRATPEGMFLTFVAGGSGACYTGPDSVPAWLRTAVGYRADGADRLLVDPAGRTLARLVPGGRPKVPATVAESRAAPPVLTPELRESLGAAAPLPSGLRPATAADLARRWVPGKGPAEAFARLAPDGSWDGSDGCNGQSGRWTAGAGGAFLAVAGAQTLIGCENVNIGGYLYAAARAGFDGDELVLVDRTGREVARLVAG